jgi:hypothetical protein
MLREIVGVGGEQRIDLSVGGGREIVLSDEGDRLVPVVAPGAGLVRKGSQHRKAEQYKCWLHSIPLGNEYAEWHSEGVVTYNF